MEYREVLKSYLEQANMTPAELARRIGSPRSTIHEILAGRSKEPTLGRAKAIADALGVSLDDMAKEVYEDKDHA